LEKKINPFLLLFIIHNYYELDKKQTYLIHPQTNYKLNKSSLFSVFFVEINNTYKYSRFLHYQFFNLNYLQNIFKINLKEKSINGLDCLPSKITKFLMYKVRHISYKQFGVKYFNEVAHLFVLNV
jgi:hypothetical protein